MAMNIIKELITDRQQSDVDRLNYLNNKKFEDMTADEKREWFGDVDIVHCADRLLVCADGVLEIQGNPPKGGYNCADLNRVGKAILYVADILNSVGCHIRPTVRTDWQKDEMFYQHDLKNYLDNVEVLRSALAVWQDTPQTPTFANLGEAKEDKEEYSYQYANDIEKIINDVYEVLSNMIAAYRYCGTFYAGE